MRLVYMLFYTFKIASCYFVALIVFLRMAMVRNPTKFRAFHKKITMPSCILIWILVVALCFFPTAYLQSHVINDNYIDSILVIMRLHTGVTLPISFAILINVYLSLYLKQSKTPTNNLSRNEQNNKVSFQKLINGLVIWLIVCNAPFIAWLHYHLYCRRVQKTPWIGTSGVWIHLIYHFLILYLQDRVDTLDRLLYNLLFFCS